MKNDSTAFTSSGTVTLEDSSADWNESSNSSSNDFSFSSYNDFSSSPYIEDMEGLFSTVDISLVKDNEQKQNLSLFIKRFCYLYNTLIAKYSFPHLNTFSFSIDEDGAVILSNTVKGISLGFSLERDFSKSFWYIVTNLRLEELSQSGELSLENMDSIIMKVLLYVLRYI